MQFHSTGPLLLVGCGKMGGAMLAGWLARGLPPSKILVQEPKPAPEVVAQLGDSGITLRPSYAPSDVSDKPAVILLAVKPQVMEAVFESVVPLIGPETIVLSVAAGRTIASFEAASPPGTGIVRAIPNTPAAIGRGITVCCPNANVSSAQRDVCSALLTAIGEVGWVEREELIDAATAVSGSGPAYVFLMAECLAAAGEKVGLPADLSRQLAQSTIAGAGELMRQTGEDPAQLRRNVTSPNGTTQAALDILMSANGLEPLMREAVAAACRRSRELAG